MIKLIRTDSNNEDFRHMVKLLDQYLAKTDGDDHAFYDQYNQLHDIKNVIICYENEKPIGCGAFKAYNKESVEIKRMFTLPEARGKGIASQILETLEAWAKELSYTKCILETGIRQVEAVGFYKKSSYHLIPNYGQYAGVNDSLCFEKWIKD